MTVDDWDPTKRAFVADSIVEPRFEGDGSWTERHPSPPAFGPYVAHPLAVSLETLANDLERESRQLGCSVNTAYLKRELARRIRRVVRGA